MKLAIITGSVRQGRVSNHLAEAVAKRASQLDDVEVVQLDLKELALPIFDEAVSPKFNSNRQLTGAAKQWLEALDEADGYVLVSPEYNKSIPGALKNALDYIAHEVDNKPFGLVSHGSANGAYAIANLRVIIPELGGVSTPRFVGLPYGSYDAEGRYSGNPEERDQYIDDMLKQVKGYAEALVATR